MSLEWSGGNEKGNRQTTDLFASNALFTHPDCGSDTGFGWRSSGCGGRQWRTLLRMGWIVDCGLRGRWGYWGLGGVGRKQAATICTGLGPSPACPAVFPSFYQGDYVPHLLLKTFDFASKAKAVEAEECSVRVCMYGVWSIFCECRLLLLRKSLCVCTVQNYFSGYRTAPGPAVRD